MLVFSVKNWFTIIEIETQKLKAHNYEFKMVMRS